MSKRFIDTGFLDQKWIRKLSPEKKIFLIYLMLKCDNAGIIDLDFDDISFWIGKRINNIDFLPENYLIPIDNNGKYFMPKFIEWQYPNFPHSKVHQQEQAKQILIKHGIFDVVNQLINLPKTYLKLTQGLPEAWANGNGNGNGNDNGNDKKEGSGGKTKKQFLPPTLDEVEIYFKEKGYKKEIAKRAWMGYDTANWHDSKGKQILNWKQKMIHVWFSEENKTSNKNAIFPGFQLSEEDKQLLKESGYYGK